MPPSSRSPRGAAFAPLWQWRPVPRRGPPGGVAFALPWLAARRRGFCPPLAARRRGACPPLAALARLGTCRGAVRDSGGPGGGALPPLAACQWERRLPSPGARQEWGTCPPWPPARFGATCQGEWRLPSPGYRAPPRAVPLAAVRLPRARGRGVCSPLAVRQGKRRLPSHGCPPGEGARPLPGCLRGQRSARQGERLLNGSWTSGARGSRGDGS